MTTAVFNTITEAVEDLKAGKIIIVCDDENRENEGDFIALAEFATPEVINFMITNGRGLLCTPLTEEYAKRLSLLPMVVENTDILNTPFTVSIDHISNGTGISAYDRAATISKILDSNSIPSDFRRPGHTFPLVAKPGGVFARRGHTEATVDLARLCGSAPVGVLCEIMNADGTMARVKELHKIARHFNLKMITIKDLIQYRRHSEKLVTREAVVELPTDVGKFRMYGYSNLLDFREHVAIVKGDLSNINLNEVPVMVRIHSECLTGDVFHSRRCDCGEQLNVALSTIEQEGLGVIIYLRQEGRGIGLLNKLKAYELQETGIDTVDANLKLGFASDLREYVLAAKILVDLGIHKIRLITNNPVKIKELTEANIQVVERISLKTTAHPENQRYLATKVKKFGHLL